MSKCIHKICSSKHIHKTWLSKHIHKTWWSKHVHNKFIVKEWFTNTKINTLRRNKFSMSRATCYFCQKNVWKGSLSWSANKSYVWDRELFERTALGVERKLNLWKWYSWIDPYIGMKKKSICERDIFEWICLLEWKLCHSKMHGRTPTYKI